MRMDYKVHGTLISNKTGKEIPEDEFVVFRPHDDAVPEMLEHYRLTLYNQGATPEQIEAVAALQARVDAWRKAHPERCKVADVEPGELRAC